MAVKRISVCLYRKAFSKYRNGSLRSHERIQKSDFPAKGRMLNKWFYILILAGSH